MSKLKPCPFCGSEKLIGPESGWNTRPIEDNLQDELKQKHERLRYFENRNTELATESICGKGCICFNA